MTSTPPSRAEGQATGSNVVSDALPSDRAEFRRTSVEALAARVAGAALQLFFSLVIARTIGPAGAGLFFLALTGATVAAVLGRVGLDNAVVRFVAANAASRHWGAVRGVYRAAMWIAVPSAAAATVALWVAAPWLAVAVFRKPEVAAPLRFMAVGVIPLTLVALHGEALRGLKRIVTSQLVQTVALPGLALVALLLTRIHDATGVTRAYVIGATVAACIGVALWVRVARGLPALPVAFSGRLLLHTSLPLFGMAAMDFILTWTGTISLGIWRTSRDVGVFSIASRVSATTTYALAAANIGLAPKFAELWNQGERHRLGALARHSAATVAMVAAPVVILLLVWPGVVLRLFGSGFAEGATALRVMVLGQYVNVATGAVGYLLVMSGNERTMRNVVTASMVSNVALNLALVPALGVLGAAIANAASAVVQNLLATFMVHRKLGIASLPLLGGGD